MSDSNELSPRRKLAIIIMGTLSGILFLVALLFDDDSSAVAVENEAITFQVWNQSECKICKNPWMQFAALSEITNLSGSLNEWGEESPVGVEGWVIFNDVELHIPPGGKDYASFWIGFNYYADNCHSKPLRKGRLNLKSSNFWKNKELLVNAKNGQKFDIKMNEPLFTYRMPASACESGYWSFSSDDVLITPSSIH